MILEISNDDEYLDDLINLTPGANGCRGQLAIVHSRAGSPESDLKTRLFQPSNYKNTKRRFRRREIVKAEVFGTCRWNLHSQKRFRGQTFHATSGFDSHLPFVPFSISQP